MILIELEVLKVAPLLNVPITSKNTSVPMEVVTDPQLVVTAATDQPRSTASNYIKLNILLTFVSNIYITSSSTGSRTYCATPHSAARQPRYKHPILTRGCCTP